MQLKTLTILSLLLTTILAFPIDSIDAITNLPSTLSLPDAAPTSKVFTTTASIRELIPISSNEEPTTDNSVDKIVSSEKRAATWSSTCYGSGARMDRANFEIAIGKFCEEKNGWLTLKNFELGVWMNIYDVKLADGQRGVVHLGYMNTHGSDSGWLVKKEECYPWMGNILNACINGKGVSRGGRYLTSSGYLFLDANANWWD